MLFKCALNVSSINFLHCFEENKYEVQRLLRNGADPNGVDESGNSALLLAAKKGKIHSCHQNIEIWWWFMHLWCVNIVVGSENLIRLLVENGGDVNVVGSGGKTALIYAALNGNSHGRLDSNKTIKLEYVPLKNLRICLTTIPCTQEIKRLSSCLLTKAPMWMQ